MTYYFMDITDSISGETTRHIFRHLSDNGVQSFPDVESNDGPERTTYLKWVVEGNQPEPWPVEVGE